MHRETRDVVVIGAGPSGAIAAALLNKRGWKVLVLEAQRFPRFSIGESLLAHCLDFIAEADMIDALHAHGFQPKNGAAFACGDARGAFDFAQNFNASRAGAYHVERAPFDKLLADEAEKQGVEVRYEVHVTGFSYGANNNPVVSARDKEGREYSVEARFIMDASGFGRVLPKLLDLETPSNFPVRQSIFTHIEDRIDDPTYDRNKTLITIHPEHEDVWFWLIPFSNGRASLGVVAERAFFDRHAVPTKDKLRALVNEEPVMSRLLGHANWDTPARELTGYAANVKAMHGPGFVLLGNAAEFLDPVFSSGVTIAMRSSSMASAVLDRQLRGERVSWDEDFVKPLKRGVETFRAYVNAWYDGRFREIIFAKYQVPEWRRMMCSVLAGYAWDEQNPFVSETERRLELLAELCERQ